MAMESVGVDLEEIDRTEELYRARDRERLKAQIATGDLRAQIDRIITAPEPVAETESKLGEEGAGRCRGSAPARRPSCRAPSARRAAPDRRRSATGSPTAARWAIARSASSAGQRPRSTEKLNAIAMPIATASPCGSAGLRLDRMAEAVAEIEQGAPALGVALVAGDERRLGARRRSRSRGAAPPVAGEQRRAIAPRTRRRSRDRRSGRI